jgi:hypothetical protein
MACRHVYLDEDINATLMTLTSRGARTLDVGMLLDLDSAKNWTRPTLLLHGIKRCFPDREDLLLLDPQKITSKFYGPKCPPWPKALQTHDFVIYDDLAQKLE